LRQAVILVYFQGLKYQDAAEVMDIPVGTVKSRLHAALTKLTEEWGGETDSGSSDPDDSGMRSTERIFRR
jgi:RNA polymerase sigma-70 factor (ECF subfamily)